MGYKETAGFQEELVKIRQGGYETPGEMKKALRVLPRKLGARDPGWHRGATESEIEAAVIDSIQQALQTRAMIDMCESTAKGYQIAVEASRSATKSFWIASAIAILSMLAAWAAAIVALTVK